MLSKGAGNRFALVVGTLVLIGGCQSVGPIAIDQGRDRYNNIIQSTSKEQTFSNIIRVFHHEPTVFMDVAEVDATTTFSGSVSGGVTNVGAGSAISNGTFVGQSGNVAGGVTYTESPLIRYTPLLGQALVVQLATPVGPDALASLYDSSWYVTPLLDFSTSFLTLEYDDYYAALNLISQLDHDQRLELVAEKSDVTKAKETVKTSTLQQTRAANVTLEVTNKSSSEAADALVIYFQPPRRHHAPNSDDQSLWNRLRGFYRDTQPMPKPSGKQGASPLDRNRIELRTMPVATADMHDNHLVSGAPLMKTFSALGILKNATEAPRPKIAFIDPERFSRIRNHPWNKGPNDLAFYTLLPEDENNGDDVPKDGEKKVQDKVVAWLWRTYGEPGKGTPFLYRSDDPADFIAGNRRLGALRRYILIVAADHAPPNAYVAHFARGTWYYIDGEDELSQKNFNLITLFLTMMAAPPATQPLVPSISVGGGG